MNVETFKDFLIACVGASASFIGLLFVALSVVLTRNDAGAELGFKDRRLAETSFTALADVFFVSISAGVALYPTDGKKPSELLRFADMALYEAKKMGGNRFQFYTKKLKSK